MKSPIIFLIAICFSLFFIPAKLKADDGYKLWLNYQELDNPELVKDYVNQLQYLIFQAESPTLKLAKAELLKGYQTLLDLSPLDAGHLMPGAMLIGTPKSLKILDVPVLQTDLRSVNSEGFVIRKLTIHNISTTVITANTDIGVLYGVFRFLSLLQTHRSIRDVYIVDSPAIKHRILNHWDNLDRSVERGYAGQSLWDWHKLPDYIDQRYIDYARANASIGINGTVLTNVNANALTLTPAYLKKAAALATVFRPYGIKVYLTARFSAPMEIGGLKTADPHNKDVINWWKDKTAEIYKVIPDFGGFLVKANSEGQPGPQNYGRSHADGANVLATALKPFGGIVMWRAFVYDDKVPDDRAKQAYSEFTPLDGLFEDNVILQVKNGPIDFQPREPFHPLFGAMPKTPLMMEFQLTQEYLGFATHLVYLGTLFQETLRSDTYSKGPHSWVRNVIDGSLDKHSITAMAGVANIGTDRNWTGHPFGQANWYAYGKLAWNPASDAQEIANDWIRMTFTNDRDFLRDVETIMMHSREAVVNYMTPLGLHHLMGWDHHYGPGPWIKDKPRIDWTAVYYHKADETGIGFNRTSSGSNALGQYAPTVRQYYENLKTCPKTYLLWFHHLPWHYKVNEDTTLWNALCYQYEQGVQDVKNMQLIWRKQENKIDEERFKQVNSLLAIQYKEAKWWRDACLSYFQSKSGLKFPAGIIAPPQPLTYYENLKFHYVPGI